MKKDVKFVVKDIEQLANQIISAAIKSEATDIHIVPRLGNYAIQFRIVNSLQHYLELNATVSAKLISHFKFSAGMDIGELRRPQTGSFRSSYNNVPFDFRLSTLPSNSNESLVIRILPQFDQMPLEQLSLFPTATKKLLTLLKQAHGLIIFSGPTGSGKTTTVYSLINETIKQHDRNVITLEDPIEKPTANFIQVQVNEKAGVTYSTGLKAILRHDPDIIFVGEIRDAKTAKIAVRAAMTGHLVLSSMHARDAKGAIHRLLEFGVPLVEIEQTLIAATAQRLVELTCFSCNLEVCQNDYMCSRTKHRATIFEILSGSILQAVLQEMKGEPREYNYKKLENVLRKGIALGYIKNTEYERWINNETLK